MHIYFPDTLSPSQVDKLTGHQWYIEGTCAKTGKGLNESFQKMASLMNRRKK
jgi:ribonuclease I